MTKLTEKQEKFCQKYIELGNASEAYRQAYDCSNSKPEGIHVRACELLKNSNVIVRLNELREVAQKRHEITVDDLVRELEEARQAAMTAETVQASAATGAIMGKAKLLGLIVDKQQINNEITLKTARDFTDDELASIATRGSARTPE